MTETVPDAWVDIGPRPEGDPDTTATNPYVLYRPAMGRLIGAHPEIGPKFLELFVQVMFMPGHLDRREREMVAAVAAAAQDCFY